MLVLYFKLILRSHLHHNGCDMTNESIKTLLMIMLFGGLRTLIFVMEIPKSQLWLGCQALLDWLKLLAWPAMALPDRALQPIFLRHKSSRRQPLR
ncbi:MAG: hypothetical protein ACXWKP_10895 [Bradyrhizobium sp.]